MASDATERADGESPAATAAAIDRDDEPETESEEPAAGSTAAVRASGDGPRVLLLARHHLYALQIAAELSSDLDATVIGVGGETSPIARSRYCDDFERTFAEDPDRLGASIADIAASVSADVVLPVGQLGVRALDAARDSLPTDVACPLPPSGAIETALSKPATAEVAREVGVAAPETLATLDPARPADEQIDPAALAYPAFLKAAEEAGRNHVASVAGPRDLVDSFEELRSELAPGQEVLVQEDVNATDRTYACGMLFADGRPALSFCHEEVRSIPREGGTGTRVRHYRDPELERRTERLLDALDWEGPALVEFTRRADGEYVLMEINPKFWSSYPLASRSGYRFASRLVAESVDGVSAPNPPKQTGSEMVFPIRELYHVLQNRETESLTEAARAMAWPPAHVDVRLRDLPAWVAPAGLGTSVQWALDLWRGEDEPI